jgi:hypothetical protein
MVPLGLEFSLQLCLVTALSPPVNGLSDCRNHEREDEGQNKRDDRYPVDWHELIAAAGARFDYGSLRPPMNR